MNEERFNVVVFDPEGFWHYAQRDLPAKQAVEEAHRLVTRAAVNIGIDRVMITDADDNTNFLWERGRGIVYPDGLQKRHQERDDDG